MNGHFTGSNPIADDLQARWRPSLEQQVYAEKLLKHTLNPATYTTHLLIHKTFGVWHRDVEVIPLDGVFTDREAASLYVQAAASAYHNREGDTVLGGYARHTEHGWAVFEDILAEFPNRRTT